MDVTSFLFWQVASDVSTLFIGCYILHKLLEYSKGLYEHILATLAQMQAQDQDSDPQLEQTVDLQCSTSMKLPRKINR